jgi:hypothetical protein
MLLMIKGVIMIKIGAKPEEGGQPAFPQNLEIVL